MGSRENYFGPVGRQNNNNSKLQGRNKNLKIKMLVIRVKETCAIMSTQIYI